MTKTTILEKNFDKKLRPEIILVMTYIKNNCAIKVFSFNTTLHKV